MIMTDVIIDYFPSSVTNGLSGTEGKIVFVPTQDRRSWASRACMITGDRYVVCDEIHQWFMEIDPHYCLRVSVGKKWVPAGLDSYGRPKDKCAFVLRFRDPKLAMMFKLRWFNE